MTRKVGPIQGADGLFPIIDIRGKIKHLPGPRETLIWLLLNAGSAQKVLFEYNMEIIFLSSQIGCLLHRFGPGWQQGKDVRSSFSF
jgi:hypothetical protein